MTQAVDESEPGASRASRRNIAFTLEAEEAAKRVRDRLQMPEDAVLDVARVSIAFALREQLPLDRRPDLRPGSGRNYNVGSVDPPPGELRNLLLAMHPELREDPYRVLETLMNEGALKLDRKIATAEVLNLRDLLQAGS